MDVERSRAMREDRRGFLKTVTAVLAGLYALLPSRRAEGTLEKLSKKKVRLGMVIDTKRCIGCRACTMACKQENKTPPGVYYMQVLEQEVGEYPNVMRSLMPKPCYHCENPSCVKVCPTRATYKREEDGIVVIDYDKCIGCRYCITACPYGARYFDFGEYYHEEESLLDQLVSPEYGENRGREGLAPPVGCTRKCTFCLHRVEQGLLPACVTTCMTRALHFGDLNDPESEVSRLLKERRGTRPKEELGNEPNVYYLY